MTRRLTTSAEMWSTSLRAPLSLQHRWNKRFYRKTGMAVALRLRIERLPSSAISNSQPMPASGRSLFVVWFCMVPKLAIIGITVLTMLSTSIPAIGQISPGALSRSHRSVQGLDNCTSCHELSTGKRTFRCLSCHKEIAWRIEARKGLHASFELEAESSNKCVDCHPEHNGENAPLTKWNVDTFDHEKTGYKLEGKHIGLACSRCHSPEHIDRRELATIRITDLTRTFLGVSPRCANCHHDPHKGHLGEDCLQCHNFIDWKTINIISFDHSLSRYPLTGLHVKVRCELCHNTAPDKKPRYIGIPFGDCSDCHTDPHRGRFTQTCRSCHDTAGWNKTSPAEMNRTFDHSKTKFPLLGKHREVDCVQCHVKADFQKPLVFQKCSDCHHPDPHGGQFSKRTGRSECSNCHSVDTFKPSTFGLKEHRKTAYPLEGKHATVSCARCHVPKGKATIYAIKFRYCTDCHTDQHANQFAGAPYLNRCENCHSLLKFVPSTFNLQRHSEVSFRLAGSHMAVACNDCHKQTQSLEPKLTARYRWPILSCASCHADPHGGRFKKFLVPAGANSLSSGCPVCHSSVTWTDLSPFDHARTSFALSGAHKSVPCAACHKPDSPSTGLMQVDFTLAPRQCSQCHPDVHGHQFSNVDGGECGRCHDVRKWKPSLFNHDKQSSFPLEGAHRNVLCESCHKLTRVVAGNAIVFYKPTSKECVACHGRDLRRTN